MLVQALQLEGGTGAGVGLLTTGAGAAGVGATGVAGLGARACFWARARPSWEVRAILSIGKSVFGISDLWFK